MQKSVYFTRDGRREHTRKGRSWGLRLGSEAQLGTSIATFSADRAGSFMLKESPRGNNTCPVRMGPRPHGWSVSTGHSLQVPLPPWLSASQSLTPLSGKCSLPSLPPSRGWHKGSTSLGRQCGWLCSHCQGESGIPLPHPTLAFEGR